MIALGKNIPMWIKKGAKGNMVKNPDITTFRKFEIRVAFLYLQTKLWPSSHFLVAQSKCKALKIIFR